VEHSPVSETETNHSPQSSHDVPVPAEDTQQGQTQHTPDAVGASYEDSQDVSTVEPVEPPLSSSLVVEEEVRPFTDFIEEFRQAEARFSASLQEYQTSPLPSHTSTPEEVEAGRNEENTTSVTNNVDEVEAVAQFVTSHSNNVPNETAVAQSTPEQDGGTPATTPSTEEAQTPVANETAETKPAVVPPTARPVSPLLRPATPRGRTPRHVGSRHHEAPPVATPPPVAPVETVEPTPSAEQVPAAEVPGEEQPRPARRYRFDRPSKVNTPATPVTPTVNTPSATPLSARIDESKDVADRETPSVPVRPNNGHQFNGQTSEKESAEPIVPKQPVAQELPVVENTSAPVAPSAQEERRRRHSQDRQRVKAQPVAAPAPVAPSPVVEVVPPVATPVAPVVAQGSEVSPEDLPPLEYSELQKANSRRRRRRHTSSTVAPAVAASMPLPPTPKVVVAVVPELSAPIAPVTPIVATPSPLPPSVSPRPAAATVATAATPASAVPPGAAFTMTSGYTVNQMNQNHEGKNPFMGPDPSPARGTMAAQTARSIRTDVQRVPAYPVRTTEATSASVHQLANVVSQAIQTQTDRMIAELRRANQGPTNISVSMPPMPSNERVGVFVDVANLLYSARTLRMTVDFGKLLDFLRGNRRLIRAQAYCPTSPQPGDEQMFLQAVKGLGYRITTKNYKIFASGAKKADLDLDLCMDVVRLVDGKAVDCIVLVSGDSDFMPMLDYCSDHGVRVEVAAFDEAMSATLRQSCDLFINLSMLEEIRA